VLGFESIDSHVEFSIVYRDAGLIVHHICEQDTLQNDATKQFISKGHCSSCVLPNQRARPI